MLIGLTAINGRYRTHGIGISQCKRDGYRLVGFSVLACWFLYTAGQQSIKLDREKAILALQAPPGQQLIVREVYHRPDGQRRAIVALEAQPDQEFWFPVEPPTFVGEPRQGALIPRFKVGDQLVVTADRKVDWYDR